MCLKDQKNKFYLTTVWKIIRSGWNLDIWKRVSIECSGSAAEQAHLGLCYSADEATLDLELQDLLSGYALSTRGIVIQAEG